MDDPNATVFYICLALGCLKLHLSTATYKPAQVPNIVCIKMRSVAFCSSDFIKFFTPNGKSTNIFFFLLKVVLNLFIIYIEADAGGGVSSGARRPVSVFGSGEPGKKSSEGSMSGDPLTERLTNLTPQHFQGGRAEALGALCRYAFLLIYLHCVNQGGY